MNQNIYDNEVFFTKYQELRQNEANYNQLVEQPAIRRVLPDLNGKSVLDLGCGYGCNCMDFVRRGAARVVGVDLSQKMLAVAQRENFHKSIEYLRKDMGEIGDMRQAFDLVFSSLAFHYVEDFQKLLRDIGSLLVDGGVLLFSQEHPHTTAPKSGSCWTKDRQGNKMHYNLSDYMKPGKRTIKWWVDGVEKYHRTLSEIINTIIGAGFILNQLVEPLPDEEALEKRPDFSDEFHKTSCIIIKATKIQHLSLIKYPGEY